MPRLLRQIPLQIQVKLKETYMDFFKSTPFFVLLLSIISFAYQDSSSAEARAAPPPFLSPQQVGHWKDFSTLGVVCRCCDAGGSSIDGEECTNSWVGYCSNLQCLPWKLHNKIVK
ncbi:uncharacterized protein Fot_08167 [Forsythia ovata]|uniref:Uncharacterized protein n=1 Tax=Forsythia ovata TaxID=205694 RepID=A0ABD1WXX4_9LAMI